MSNLLRSISNIIIAMILVTVVTSVTNARWLQPGESDLIFDNMNIDVIINDNEISCTKEFQATIITDQGKEEAIAWRNYYNPSYKTLEVLDAYTILGRKKYHVPNKFIEDKMLYSCGAGFDRIHCLTIAFPKAEIGAKIYLKLRVNSKSPVNNHFSMVTDFTGYEHKKYSCSINSSMPVYVNINDPNNKLELVQTKKNKSDRYLTKIKLTKPIAAAIRNEPYYSLIDEHSKTMFSMSTDSSWEDIGKKLTKDYFAVIDQPLPAELKAIVDDAKKYTNSAEQINFVTAKLQNALSGIGGAVCTISGKFIPRDLIRIVDIGVADSKDFVVATAAVLKELQYEVYPILVADAGMKYVSQVKLPNIISISKLDYTALKVIDSSGKAYWLDPSYGASAANSIPLSIHDRMVLVLSRDSATYEKVPEIAPEHSQEIVNTAITRKSGRSINYNGSITLKGHCAALLTGLALYHSPEVIKDSMFYALSGVTLDNHNKKNIVIPDLTSRIVQDYDIEYEYEDNQNNLTTNLGYGLQLFTPSPCRIIASAIPDQVGDLHILQSGTPRTAYNRRVIKDEVLQAMDKLNYKIDTPWIYIEQSCRQVGNDSEIVFKYIVRKPIISNLELQGAMYKKLKKDVERFVNNAYVVLSKK